MQTMTTKGMIELLSKGGLSAALIIILVYFGSLFLNSIGEIQKDLANIRIELVKIQGQILTEQRVEKMIDDRIEKTVYKYHK